MQADPRGFYAALFTAAAWGFTGIFIKLLPGYSPVAITAGRLLISLALLLPLTVSIPSWRTAALDAAGRPVGWWLGVLGVAYFGLAVPAYDLAPVGEVALLLSTTPLFVMAANRCRGVRPTRREAAGALLAMTGIAIVILPGLGPAGGFSVQRVAGHVLALGSSAAAGTSGLLLRILEERKVAPDAFGIALLTFLIGSLVLSGLSVLTVTSGEWIAPDGRDIGVLLSLGIGCTLVPTVTYAVASQRLPAVLNATIRLLIPVFAAVAAVPILGEVPSWWLLPGGALVIGGILTMLRSGPITAEAAAAEPLGD